MKNKIKTSLLFLFLVCIFVMPTKLLAATVTNEGVATASEVLVVYNASYITDSNIDGTQDSQEVAEYYQSKRSIPVLNVMSITAPTTEVVSRTDYNTHIKAEIETYLTNNSLVDSIKYIVLVKGVPLKIAGSDGLSFGVYGEADYSSVDAAVCLLYQSYDIVWRVDNPYFNVDPNYYKAYRFKTNHFIIGSTTLKYLVTRLDGYTVLDIKGMIDRAFTTDTSGEGYWVLDGHLKFYDSMSEANTIMTNYGFNITPSPYTDTTDYITSTAGDIMGYTGHGIHASMINGYVSSTLSDFSYVNGAVIQTYESYSGYGFVSPNQSSHGQVAEFIAEGASGGIGMVYEPWSATFGDEDIWMPAYALGYTWADAAYMSLPFLDFVVVVIGDPLMTINNPVSINDITSMSAVSSDGQVDLSWVNPVSGYVGTKIFRKIGSYPVGPGDGTIVYSGTDNSYIDTDVTNYVTYYYMAYAHDGHNNFSSNSVGAGVSAISENDSIPPGSISALQSVPGFGQISLTWTNPIDSDYVGTKIVSKVGDYPANHSDGTEICDTSNTSCVAAGLATGVTYYFSGFSYDTGFNYSSLIDGSITMVTTLIPSGWSFMNDFSVPGFVYNLNAIADDNQVTLSWVNPSDVDFKGVRIVRRTDYYPTSSTDGTLVWQGNNTGHIDDSVINNMTYFYTIFSYDGVPNYTPSLEEVQILATPCSGSCSDSSPGAPPSNSFSEPDNTSPEAPTNMNAVANNSSVSLSWDNSLDDTDWSGSLIVRKTNTYPVTQSDGLIIYYGTNSSYVDSNVLNSITYYYSVFSYDTVPNFSISTEEARVSATLTP